MCVCVCEHVGGCLFVLVFGTGYIPGGELYMYMGDRMKEPVAKFYVAQLAIALDFMHRYVVFVTAKC